MIKNPWQALKATLDRHGYAFQCRVADEIRHLSPWTLETQEFPVEVREQATQIDLVAQRGSEDIYIVGECKLPHDRFPDWCFAMSAVLQPRGQFAGCVFERAVNATQFNGKPDFFCHPAWVAERDEKQLPAQHDFVFPVKLRNSPKGKDQEGREVAADSRDGRKLINDTIAQVCRGASGLLDYWQGNRFIHENKRQLVLIPAVFTTASLWTCTRDLAEASLETGVVSLKQEDVTEVGYAFHRCRVGPMLRSKLAARTGPSHYPSSFGTALTAEFLRTVVFVNIRSLKGFLNDAARWKIEHL